jgi:hypothetical protein
MKDAGHQTIPKEATISRRSLWPLVSLGISGFSLAENLEVACLYAKYIVGILADEIVDGLPFDQRDLSLLHLRTDKVGLKTDVSFFLRLTSWHFRYPRHLEANFRLSFTDWFRLGWTTARSFQLLRPKRRPSFAPFCRKYTVDEVLGGRILSKRPAIGARMTP